MRFNKIPAMLVVAALAVGTGCKKKTPPAPSAQQQAPTITQPQEQVPPPAAPEPQRPTPEENAQGAPATQPAPEVKTSTQKHKPKAPKKSASKKTPQPKKQPPQAAQQATKPPTTEGNVQLSASIPQGEAARQRQVTAQLLTQTENTLKSITRTLSDDEQRTVLQIRGFMQQSRTADLDGDLDRSYNLATKAKLLADELVKH